MTSKTTQRTTVSGSPLLRAVIHAWLQDSGALSAIPDAPVVRDQPHRWREAVVRFVRRPASLRHVLQPGVPGTRPVSRSHEATKEAN